MYTIQTLNRISDCIREVLPEGRYRIDEAAQAPDAVLVRSADMHGMEAPRSLLAVARAGAGYNNIPVDEYTKRGVCVFNTPGANANAVAELVLLGLLLSGRKVVDGIEWARALKGREGVPGLVEKGKGQFAGPELRGKTLGVIGLGAIGILVANAAAQGLGMTVLGEDPFISVQHAWSLSRAVQRVDSVEEILAQSDFVTVHVPLSEKTCGMIDSAALARMKPGARLLNFSRAELVDGEAVRAALQAGKLASYITDFPTDEHARRIGRRVHSASGRVHAGERGKLRPHGGAGASGVSGNGQHSQQREPARDAAGTPGRRAPAGDSCQRAGHGQPHFGDHFRRGDQHRKHDEQGPRRLGRDRAGDGSAAARERHGSASGAAAGGSRPGGAVGVSEKFPETPSRRLFRHFSVGKSRFTSSKPSASLLERTKNPLVLSSLPFSDTP